MGASGVVRPRELKFRGIFEPPPPSLSSGDGSCDGDVRPVREPSPALVAKGAARRIIFFRQQNSLFRQFRRFFAKWGLFFAKWGLFFASLYVRKSPTVLLNLDDPIAPLHHCRFHQPNLKLLSLSVQLERKAWQILAAVSSEGTLSPPAPFQVDDRRSCNGWHGREARQSRVRIPATD